MNLKMKLKICICGLKIYLSNFCIKFLRKNSKMLKNFVAVSLAAFTNGQNQYYYALCELRQNTSGLPSGVSGLFKLF